MTFNRWPVRAIVSYGTKTIRFLEDGEKTFLKENNYIAKDLGRHLSCFIIKLYMAYQKLYIHLYIFTYTLLSIPKRAFQHQYKNKLNKLNG